MKSVYAIREYKQVDSSLVLDPTSNFSAIYPDLNGNWINHTSDGKKRQLGYIDNGTIDGQIPYWDNTNGKYITSSSFKWDNDNSYLNINGYLTAPAATSIKVKSYNTYNVATFEMDGVGSAITMQYYQSKYALYTLSVPLQVFGRASDLYLNQYGGYCYNVYIGEDNSSQSKIGLRTSSITSGFDVDIKGRTQIQGATSGGLNITMPSAVENTAFNIYSGGSNVFKVLDNGSVSLYNSSGNNATKFFDLAYLTTNLLSIYQGGRIEGRYFKVQDIYSSLGNVQIGYNTYGALGGIYNTFIGAGAGNTSSTGSVCIGKNTGTFLSGDSKMIIGNGDYSTALLSGDFAHTTLKINGVTTIQRQSGTGNNAFVINNGTINTLVATDAGDVTITGSGTAGKLVINKTSDYQLQLNKGSRRFWFDATYIYMNGAFDWWMPSTGDGAWNWRMYQGSTPVLDINNVGTMQVGHGNMTWFNDNRYLRLRGNTGDNASNVLEIWDVSGNTNCVIKSGGNYVSNGSLQTADPGSGRGVWKLGKKVTATVSLITTDYIEVDIDGVIYKLALVN